LATSRYFVIMKSVQNFTFGLILISRRMTFWLEGILLEDV
jgi:hypothetical protein